MSISRYPLQWPAGWKRETYRKRGKFGTNVKQYGPDGQHQWNRLRDVTIAEATQRVNYELGRIAADGDFVISTNLRLRLDGMPRGDQSEPRDPGVAVYWNAKGGKNRVMAIDIYDRVADNLAAVAATLEAMRAIERHGGAAILERTFTGFDALPPPRSCWDVLGVKRNGDSPVELEGKVQSAFREKAKRAHPDQGGSHAAMAELSGARDEAMRIISEMV